MCVAVDLRKQHNFSKSRSIVYWPLFCAHVYIYPWPSLTAEVLSSFLTFFLTSKAAEVLPSIAADTYVPTTEDTVRGGGTPIFATVSWPPTRVAL